MKFLKLIERLEDLMLAGLGVPLTPWTVVNGDRLIPLLDKIREQLPEEIREANRLMTQREQMLEDARRQSVHILHDAREQAESLLSESSLMAAVQQEAQRIRQQIMADSEALRVQAEQEAQQIIQEAQLKAEQVQAQAFSWADQMLSQLSGVIAEQSQMVSAQQSAFNRQASEQLASLNSLLSTPLASPQAYPQANHTSQKMPRKQALAQGLNASANGAGQSPDGVRNQIWRQPPTQQADTVLNQAGLNQPSARPGKTPAKRLAAKQRLLAGMPSNSEDALL
ncbi:MAG: ATP synthase F0 subunit B [Vampirovibrionales bacterium]|nr:ATP synthase F0 subunit B [Vampirovibrionales bacterium]